jgi:hypothetical protein
MTPDQLRFKLVHAATEYDRKQEGKRGYNPYALLQYFVAIDQAIAHHESGKTIRQALVSNFCDRLLDCLLKAVGEPKSTKGEA